jgi:cell division septation protein DedD
VNSRYSRDSDLHDLQDDLNDPVSNDREISLGTSTILGIFFALALVCAVFFGFGYSMGRRSAQPPATTVEPVATTSSTSSKPTPGSLAPAPTADKEADDATPPAVSPASATADISATASARVPQPDTQNALAETPPSKPAPVVRVASPATTSSAPATPGTASAVVQVAAVSHQQDADVLLSELKKRGYTVAIRQEPQDKLLHVQLGPFPSKKDAEAMRQRLLADGYNAIVK